MSTRKAKSAATAVKSVVTSKKTKKQPIATEVEVEIVSLKKAAGRSSQQEKVQKAIALGSMVASVVLDSRSAKEEAIASAKQKSRDEQQEKVQDAFQAGLDLANVVFDIISIFRR